MADNEWVIEKILSHSKSDPRSHPTSLGRVPVMLYRVKWEGSEETTWEPLGSFTSLAPLREYQRRHGLAVEPASKEDEEDDHE